MNEILVIRLYFLLGALHTIRCVAIATQRMVPAYTMCDVQLIKVAPDDGLI